MFRSQTISRLLFTLCIVSLAVFLWWFAVTVREINNLYDDLSRQLATQPTVVSTVNVDKTRLHIPAWSLFQDGNTWSLTSAERTLNTSHIPQLTPAPVAHTAGDIRVAQSIASPLTQLFDAATSDGVSLMLSSAYRSPDDQEEIYTFYLRLYGQSYVNSYVALPGASEHQTGLAVDIASYSNDCATSANNCSLDYNAIGWLQKNAAQFGFIQRYTAGKQSITGVAGEAWHYRYVGIPLAAFLSETGLTLDEFVEQAAPGYAQ